MMLSQIIGDEKPNIRIIINHLNNLGHELSLHLSVTVKIPFTYIFDYANTKPVIRHDVIPERGSFVSAKCS